MVKHTLSHYDYVAPTCHKKGSVEYRKCVTCQAFFSNAEGVCSVCNIGTPTEGLAINLINNGTAYKLSGIGRPLCIEFKQLARKRMPNSEISRNRQHTFYMFVLSFP